MCSCAIRSPSNFITTTCDPWATHLLTTAILRCRPAERRPGAGPPLESSLFDEALLAGVAGELVRNDRHTALSVSDDVAHPKRLPIVCTRDGEYGVDFTGGDDDAKA